MKTLLAELERELKGKLEYWGTKGSSYDYGTIDSEFTNTLMGEDTDVFSVIVYPEYPKSQRIFNNKKFFNIKKQKRISPLEIEVNSRMYEDNNKLNTIIEDEVKKRFNKTRDDEDYFKCFDSILLEMRKEKYTKEATEKLLFQYVFDYIESKRKSLLAKVDTEQMTEDEAFELVLKEKPELKKDILKKIKASTTETVHERTYKNQLPKNLAAMMNSYGWKQFYVKKEGKSLHIARGCSSGSGTRETHGYFAHHFAMAEKKGKSIPTYVINFDSKLKMSIHKFEKLVIHGHDITGNFHISSELSNKIIPQDRLIYCIDDLAKLGT